MQGFLFLISFRLTTLKVDVEILLDKWEIYQSSVQIESSPVKNVIKSQILKCQLRAIICDFQ